MPWQLYLKWPAMPSVPYQFFFFQSKIFWDWWPMRQKQLLMGWGTAVSTDYGDYSRFPYIHFLFQEQEVGINIPSASFLLSANFALSWEDTYLLSLTFLTMNIFRVLLSVIICDGQSVFHLKEAGSCRRWDCLLHVMLCSASMSPDNFLPRFRGYLFIFFFYPSSSVLVGPTTVEIASISHDYDRGLPISLHRYW